MELAAYLSEKKKIIDQYLDEKLPSEQEEPILLHRSIRYSVLNGGKRLRPILTLMAAELLGLHFEQVLPAAAGIELIHCFTLVHDDLPCLDDDDYRRGKLTSHKVFGEAMAVLTGDALLVMGMEFLIRNAEVKGIKKESVIRVLEKVLEILGTRELLGGQVNDINWQKEKQNNESIIDIYKKKTSALICAALETGGLLAQATEAQLSTLYQFGVKLGLAFQITDDLLDFEQDKKDYDRPNYPAVYGFKKAQNEAERYCKEAKDSISLFGEDARLFFALIDYIQHRTE